MTAGTLRRAIRVSTMDSLYSRMVIYWIYKYNTGPWIYRVRDLHKHFINNLYKNKHSQDRESSLSDDRYSQLTQGSHSKEVEECRAVLSLLKTSPYMYVMHLNPVHTCTLIHPHTIVQVHVHVHCMLMCKSFT